jgi:polyhydroxyalkanoate synthesis regulator phasin
MKDNVKKFFLLGLGIAAAGVAAGVAYKNRDKIKKAVDDLVKKGKIMKEEASGFSKELITEVEKLEKKKAAKPAKKK